MEGSCRDCGNMIGPADLYGTCTFVVGSTFCEAHPCSATLCSSCTGSNILMTTDRHILCWEHIREMADLRTDHDRDRSEQ